jgi:dihydrofolate reductase
MRRIVMFNRVSADGYFAALDGNLNWVVPEEQLDKVGADSLSDSDTILLGRRTYEMFESFWPHALDDTATAADPHSAGRRSPEIRAMAVWINNATKLVVSKSRKEVTWKNSRLLRDVDAREIDDIKRQPGKTIMIFGSGSIVSQLTQHDLIDEYHFVVGPILLGGGQSLVTAVSKRSSLNLLEAKQYPSGNVALRYARPS